MATINEYKTLQVGEQVEVDLSGSDQQVMRSALTGTVSARVTRIVPGHNDFGIWVDVEGVETLRFSAHSVDGGQTFWCPSIRKES